MPSGILSSVMFVPTTGSEPTPVKILPPAFIPISAHFGTTARHQFNVVNRHAERNFIERHVRSDNRFGTHTREDLAARLHPDIGTFWHHRQAPVQCCESSCRAEFYRASCSFRQPVRNPHP